MNKPTGAGAVMADRARGPVEADTPQMARFRKLGFFPTPPFAARAGGELIMSIDPGQWSAWEPACGQGHMAHALRGYFDPVQATDIHAHGWDGQESTFDFLSDEADLFAEVARPDWIITNPPFHLAAEFVEAGLRRARRGVAVLARLAWFETPGRYPLFFGDTPLAVYAPFFERVPMHLGRWEPKGSTATAYAWFVWTKRDAVWRAAWGDVRPLRCEVRPIPPGTRARLTHPDDARLFGAKAGAPLFEGAGDA